MLTYHAVANGGDAAERKRGNNGLVKHHRQPCTSAASGGLLGIVGSLVGVFAKSRQAKIEHERRKDEYAHELALQRLQIEKGDRETENELAITREGAIRRSEGSELPA